MNRSSMLTAGLTTVALAVALAACTGGARGTRAAQVTSSSVRSASASPVIPAGQQRIGGAAQGISIIVPSSWVEINFTQATVKQIAQRFHMGNISAEQIVQGMEELQKDNAVLVYDLKTETESPTHFITNLNAYCYPSGFTNTGSSAVPIIRQAAAEEFQSLGAKHITTRDISVGGLPGVETFYTISSTVGTLSVGQLEVVPEANRGCYVTLAGARGYFPVSVLTVAAAMARFYP
jgi:hypothetical protein